MDRQRARQDDLPGSFVPLLSENARRYSLQAFSTEGNPTLYPSLLSSEMISTL